MLLSESSQDANMASTYASLADRLISRYERQLAANELQNNQLFVGKMFSFLEAAADSLHVFSH